MLPLHRAATTFQPDTPITRASAAILFARLWREILLELQLSNAPATATTPPQSPDNSTEPNDPPSAVPVTPAAPDLTAGNATIRASWTAPANGGSAITGYKVRHRADGTSWSTPAAVGASIFTHDITGLTNGTKYQVQVQASNAVGDSGWSDSATAKPRTVPATPAAPDLTVGNATIRASWTAPSDGGSSITGYKVRHRIAGASIFIDSTWSTSGVLSADMLVYKIASLTNGTEYQVQVQAVNDAGASAWSDPAEATPRTVPSKPDAPSLAPGHEKLAVTWTAPTNTGGSAITGYNIRHSTDGTTWTTTASVGASTLTRDITGLTNGTKYQVQVQATNHAGASGWSDTAKAAPRTVPATPAAPTLAAGHEKLAVTWTAPSNGGSAITGYKVRHSTDGTTWTTTAKLGTSLSYDITGLTNGTEYQVQVQAVNTAGSGSWSDSTTATPRTFPGKPDAPTLAAGNQKLAVTWTAPTNTGGSAITGYNIRHSTDGTTWTTAAAGTTLSHNITGLTNGTEYAVQVQAINAAGSGAWSDSTEATPRTVPGKPDAPTLTAGHTKLTATWAAPASNGSAITGYKVRHSTDGTNWAVADVVAGDGRPSGVCGGGPGDGEFLVAGGECGRVGLAGEGARRGGGGV